MHLIMIFQNNKLCACKRLFESIAKFTAQIHIKYIQGESVMRGLITRPGTDVLYVLKCFCSQVSALVVCLLNSNSIYVEQINKLS